MYIKILFIFAVLGIANAGEPLDKSQATNHLYKNLLRIVKDKIKYRVSD